MRKLTLRPSKKFMALITVHGSLNAAVAHWGVPYMTVRDWLDGRHQLPSNVVVKIIETSKLSYAELFEHKTSRTKQ